MARIACGTSPPLHNIYGNLRCALSVNAFNKSWTNLFPIDASFALFEFQHHRRTNASARPINFDREGQVTENYMKISWSFCCISYILYAKYMYVNICCYALIGGGSGAAAGSEGNCLWIDRSNAVYVVCVCVMFIKIERTSAMSMIKRDRRPACVTAQRRLTWSFTICMQALFAF